MSKLSPRHPYFVSICSPGDGSERDLLGLRVKGSGFEGLGLGLEPPLDFLLSCEVLREPTSIGLARNS